MLIGTRRRGDPTGSVMTRSTGIALVAGAVVLGVFSPLYVWFCSIIVYWTGLGLLGTAIGAHGAFPRSMGPPLAVIGFATAGLVGVPLAFGVEAPGLFLAFGAGGALTTLWALSVGISILRQPEGAGR